MKQSVDLTIVIPCYKSKNNIKNVIDEIDKAFKDRNTYEIVLVNDCSPDETYEVLKQIAETRNDIIAIDLAKNVGQHAALMAGFHYASGKLIATCEDDGQTNLCVFPEMMDKINKEGFDVVAPKSLSREQPGAFRHFGSYMARMMSKWLIEKPEGVSCGVIFMAKRFVIEEMIAYRQPYPYISGLVFRTTYNVGNVDSLQKGRLSGKSGYNFSKLLNLWLNGFTAFSIKPLRISSFIGIVSAIIGFVMGIILVIRKLIGKGVPQGWTSSIAVMLFMFGLVLFVLGMIGEYIGRIYMCINQTPQYVIRQVYESQTGIQE